MDGRELWQLCRDRLQASFDAETAAREARWLLEYCRLRPFADAVPEETAARCLALTERRAGGEPLAYVLGETQFYGRRFFVGPGMLIPRNDSECVVEQALSYLPPDKPCRFADVCCGSGAYALTLLAERPLAEALATDISETALAGAEKNAAALGLSSRVRFLAGDLCAPLADASVQLLLANPPYISLAELQTLSREVLDHEPRIALTDEGDGLGFYRRLAREAPRVLAAGGRMLLEIGWQQKAAVTEILAAGGWRQIEAGKDWGGRDRWLSAIR